MSNSSLPSNLRLRLHPPSLLLALFILAYAVYFSWYTINRHNTLHSYAADLSLIDQPMWNTVRGPGGFMELTWGDHQQPRLAEHFEPILVPLALLFFLWDDVRILLIAQSIALALGALPVFWIAKRQLTINNWQLTIDNSQSPSWAALTFAAAYLLFPHLQAANVADFHADPFVVTPLLFAFWYATERRWGWMGFWAIIAMTTKETLPPLTAMLGLWLVTTAGRRRLTAASSLKVPAVDGRRSAVIHGFILILISTLWFLIATFVIVAPLARQYFGTAGPIYLASRYTPTSVLSLLQDPARWQYLLGLLAAVGFLPLLAPELLILGLPVLIANLFSNFPGQYSGEQHYSAPLVVAFILAAIYGLRRLINNISLHEENGQSLKTTTLIAVLLWLLAWMLGYHVNHGWTPLSARREIYPLRPAAVRLPDFLAQIPKDAVVSASAAIHPHLAHRQVIYVFPTVQEANYLLVDVTDIPGVHPNDAYAKLMNLLYSDWSPLKADQGLILAQKSLAVVPTPPLTSSERNLLPPQQAQDAACSSAFSTPVKGQLPCSFYDFLRPTSLPTYPTHLTFGENQLRLLGYDIHDDPDNGVTVKFYWQALDALPKDVRLWPLIYDDTGQLLSDPTQVPMIAALWYPPATWQSGEIVVTETLPQLLPDIFHLGLAVGPESSFADPGQRFPITAASAEMQRFDSGRWVQLATFERFGLTLARQPAALSLTSLTAVEASFGPAIRLTGFHLSQTDLHPGATLTVLLQWTAGQPPQADYTVFLHLLAGDGRLVAQNDAYPTWLTPQSTSHWPLHQPHLDSHRLNLPADLPPGEYTLQVGLYDGRTLQRLPLSNGSDTFTLGQIQIK
ncbi:MAG: hypothetical protein BroJett011_65440 [Chloroflexota bacterium]|nr:MAG: hypothetical protein BroJett011_65440 [Chloroflexota bacterium]